MSYFKAKMHHIRCRIRWGSSQRSPDPLRGPLSKERERGREREGEGRKGEGKEKERGEGRGKVASWL